eukprot:m.218369 g.218369  ORF g.218369 m.218369 type:complete len:423 (-) comp18680_c3_seq2:80-1348(-)
MAEPFDALEAAERGLLPTATATSSDEEGDVGGRVRRSSRTSGKKTKRSALKALKGGREAILAANKDIDDIYDEVDAKEYDRLRRVRQDEFDSFIEADEDGDYSGYLDHGGEYWDDDDYQDEHVDDKKSKRRTGAAPRRKVKKIPKKRVNSLFTGGGKASRLGASVVQPEGDDVIGSANDSFLAEVLGEQNADINLEEEEEEQGEDAASRKARKSKKGYKNLMQATLFGSSAETRQMYLQGPSDHGAPGPDSDSGAPAWVRPAKTSSPRRSGTHAAKKRPREADTSQTDAGAAAAPMDWEMAPPQHGDADDAGLPDDIPDFGGDNEDVGDAGMAAGTTGSKRDAPHTGDDDGCHEQGSPKKSKVRVLAMDDNEDEDDEDAADITDNDEPAPPDRGGGLGPEYPAAAGPRRSAFDGGAKDEDDA